MIASIRRSRLLARFLTDVGWSSLAAFAQALAVQIVVLPILGRQLSQGDFGNVLVVVSIVNITGLVAGTAMSNLVMREYGRSVDGISGPFNESCAGLNACFLISVVLSALIVLAATSALTTNNPALAALYAIALATRVYMTAEYRVRLRYAPVALSNILMAITYILGLTLLLLGDIVDPILVFAVGEAAGMLFLAYKSEFMREVVSVDSRFRERMREALALGSSAAAQNTLAYGDRIILERLIAVTAVPLFFAASVVGRIGQMAINIVATVVLSYIARRRRSDISDQVAVAVGSSIAIGLASWGVLSVLTPVALPILYPAYHEAASELVALVNIGFAAKISVIALRPFGIRMLRLRVIMAIDAGAAVLFLVGGAICAVIGGLQAFSAWFAALMTVKLAVQVAAVCAASR